MKQYFAVLTLVAAFSAQVGLSAFADSPTSSPSTGGGHAVWQAASIPLRVVSGASGIVIGAVGGSVKGIIKTEEDYGRKTFGKADENPWLIPVGVLGTVVAVPVGIVTGAPEGIQEGARYGYNVWDRF